MNGVRSVPGRFSCEDGATSTMEIEVRLRIPNMKIRAKDEHGYPIDNSTIRLRKVVDVPALPKPGEMMPLTTGSGLSFESAVVRADWDEAAGRWIVSCQFAKRSISTDEHDALINDPGWEVRPLI